MADSGYYGRWKRTSSRAAVCHIWRGFSTASYTAGGPRVYNAKTAEYRICDLHSPRKKINILF